MPNIYLSIPRKTVLNFQSANELLFNEGLARAYVPGLKLLSKAKKPDFTIGHIPTFKKQLVRRGNRLIIKNDWSGELPLDFYHLLYSVARGQFLRNNLFPVHAACIENDGLILIVGHSGAGKTSIILNLLVEKGLRVFSGNKTLVSLKNAGLKAVAGTTTITIARKYSKRYADIIDSSAPYGDRLAFSLKNKNYAAPGKIKAIVLASLNDGVAEKSILPPINALHRLYPYFLDTVNADTIINDGADVCTGTPPEKISNKLAGELRKALAKIPAYSVSGSLDFVCDAIIKL